MSNQEEQIHAWGRKYMARQQVIMNDLQELAAGMEIARAQNEAAAKPEKRELRDDEVSPWVKDVIDEMNGDKPLPEGISDMMKNVLKSQEK